MMTEDNARPLEKLWEDQQSDIKQNNEAQKKQNLLQQAAIATIAEKVPLAVKVTIAGLVQCFPGLPPQVLLGIIAHTTGQMLAGCVNGELQAMLTMRKLLKSQFEQGIQSVKVVQHPMTKLPTSLLQKIKETRN